MPVESNPEKDRNKPAFPPQKDREEVKRKLGEIAIKGALKDKSKK